MIKPLEHQKRICQHLLNDNNRGIIVFHGVGSGKTLTSILAAECLLKKFPEKSVNIITPSSLVSNFEKELKKVDFKFENLKINSYGIFANLLKKGTHICENTILIIDEAHNFGRGGKRSKYIMACAKRAFKIILLTATPVRNSPNEILPLLSMIQLKNIIDLRKSFGAAMSYLELGNSEYFNKLFKCKVSFYDVATNNSDYPTTKQHTIELKMNKEYYNAYYLIQENIKENVPEIFLSTKNLTVFLNGIRRAVNVVNLVSPKIVWTLDKIKENVAENKNVLIYSTWKSTGINIIKDSLIESGIDFTEVTGDLNKEEKTKNVKKYNSGKSKVMLITAAGSEGLDLKKTRTVIILEPYWNEARLHQIIGRAVRYKSHEGLPIKDRHVDIYNLLLVKPDKSQLIKDDKTPSADIMLKLLSEYKTADIRLFYKGLKQISIEKHKCY